MSTIEIEQSSRAPVNVGIRFGVQRPTHDTEQTGKVGMCGRGGARFFASGRCCPYSQTERRPDPHIPSEWRDAVDVFVVPRLSVGFGTAEMESDVHIFSAGMVMSWEAE